MGDSTKLEVATYFSLSLVLFEILFLAALSLQKSTLFILGARGTDIALAESGSQLSILADFCSSKLVTSVSEFKLPF